MLNIHLHTCYYVVQLIIATHIHFEKEKNIYVKRKKYLFSRTFQATKTQPDMLNVAKNRVFFMTTTSGGILLPFFGG